MIDFWRWAFSDLVSNATRGMLAEFIVACALGIDKEVRSEWEPWDLITPSGKKIEIKSAAYIQPWDQDKLSQINFSIRPSRKWDAKTNKFEAVSKRQADLYVFCLLDHKDNNTVNPLDLDQWKFFILSTKVLNQNLKNQKSIGLNNLLSLKPYQVDFSDIANCINQMEK